MSHSHGRSDIRTSVFVQRRLAVAIVPFVLVTVVGLLWLWPRSQTLGPDDAIQVTTYPGTITRVIPGDCGDVAGGEAFRCNEVTATLDEGPDEGQDITFTFAATEGGRQPAEGDGVVLGEPPALPEGAPAGTEVTHYFIDFQRTTPLLLLGFIFAAVVVGLSRWRGLAALFGLSLSLLIITTFLLPAIVEGKSPVMVAIIGSAAIMFPALYLAHGVNAQTSTAVLGTLASLALIALLAFIFVHASKFTGLSSEEATFLQVSADRINLQGLLLAGIIVGSLGVLDDVTVTQASAVWELRAVNPNLGWRELYESAIRIGRDHIASTVNTLVLAYVGASLPLLILFSTSNRSIGGVATTEVMAEEIVRTLVGSIGLVASVPITTALAALAVTSGRRSSGLVGGGDPGHSPETTTQHLVEPVEDSVKVTDDGQ